MASPAPWLHCTQTELTPWEGEDEEEEEEEEDDFERRMDEDGVIGLGEGARSPLWGDGEDPEEGSPVEEGRWHPQQDLAEEDEERGSSGGDEGPWGAESDGEPYPELSCEGRWGSGSSGSPEALREHRALCQPRGCSTDGGDTSALSDTSPGPATPSRRARGWGTAGDASGGHGQGWTPRRSLPRPLSTDDPRDATSPEPVPKPQTAPGITGLAPPEEPQGAGSPPAPKPHDRSRVPKKAAPAVVPPKPARQSRSLSPRRGTGGKGHRDPSGTGTDGTQYGRGRLNHPLPDLSKVEARVKFDQSYRPPRGRVLPARPRVPGGPVGFKSPAEIVREVLLSSGEGIPPQPPSSTGLPQEFRSPKQATALVQQLQDDYHKLLTKYAEAENTIDQLRLGARVSLFSDPPQPSRSLAVGTVGTGCRVMTLSIPQARMAALGTATDTATASTSPAGAPAPGPSDRGGSPHPRSPPPPGGGLPQLPRAVLLPRPPAHPGTGGAEPQAAGTGKDRGGCRVESFERWIHAGSPPPSEQLQRMSLLKDAQDALEREYLRGRQQLPGAAGGFDPDRAVEEEIYRLGLRLEGLKERLEPGSRRQPPPTVPSAAPPAAPLPPSPSPPPATHSPRPESPELVDGPLGTAGDNEGVKEGLPWPLWHKQLRVEEDFADLLEQYKHFKSLPQSLSLERLSLAGSGSQEEVDAPAAGDGGPGKVPCRTRSLEEGADLETFPLHPPERKAALLPSKGPPKAEGTRSHPSPATSEESPGTAKPHLVAPGPPRAPLSRRSSGTGSAAPQHGPRKVNPLGGPLPAPPDPTGGPGVLSTHPAVPVSLQEQRIVSPETDSGFVGSEASRVSPPVHTPEHRPPWHRDPRLAGTLHPHPHNPPFPTEQRDDPASLRDSTDGHLPRGRAGGHGGALPSPQHPLAEQFAPSLGRERGQRGGARPRRRRRGNIPISHAANLDSLCSLSSPAHTDSEVGDRSCASTSGHPPAVARRVPPSPAPTSPPPSPETPSPTLLSPDLPSLTPAHCDLLGSRLERDQAIRELREEVWRLRRRLEESLRRSRSYPEGKAAPCRPGQEAARGQRAIVPPGRSTLGGAEPPGAGQGGPRGRTHAEGQVRIAATGQAGAGPHLRVGPLSRRAPGTPLPAEAPWEPPGSGDIPGTAHRDTVPGGGHHVLPQHPERSRAPRGAPDVTGAGHHRVDSGWVMPPSSPSTAPQGGHAAPLAGHPWAPPVPGSRDRATQAERGPGATSSPGSHVGPRAKKPDQPGFWYLAAGPAAAAATVCLAPVPLVPYVPSVLYCSPAVPTSAPATAAVPLRLTGGNRRAQRPPRAQPRHRCLSLDLEELDELNWSLSRAVEAAQSVRVTTTRMSRALAAELGRARDLRSSCLF
ncbi:LOW QUALITY PROTEIN: AT-hook-containing transcription factor [Neopelma chrysocephalum]|uniref:LOW QUALITY PROTEIN: AT-hook-containing transcription factor n=1 Tax=Neopelma chrysocephalum TaxID=114329 RepID=UPI000FCD4B7D|nr:LOW QUALITY PROTEIN: AT-hook-containing transcription factor [Neopelma chrysocephalum]